MNESKKISNEERPAYYNDDMKTGIFPERVHKTAWHLDRLAHDPFYNGYYRTPGVRVTVYLIAAVIEAINNLRHDVRELTEELRKDRSNREIPAAKQVYTILTGLPDRPEPFITFRTREQARDYINTYFSGRDDVAISVNVLESVGDTRTY